MSSSLSLILAAAAGLFLGTLFFGGLWWTVQKAMPSKNPALWVFGSLLVRMSVTLTGFYFVSGGDWKKLIACLLGFVVARMIIKRLTRPSVLLTEVQSQGGAS